MRLIEARLKGYKHFNLRQIQELTYRPTVKTQVILGSNGSGKTSLLKELPPVAAKAKDFYVGGEEEKTYIHNGKTYVLKACFTEQGNQYYFYVDGENLNPGLLISGFNNLVEEHFHYTEKKNRVITGRLKFTQMSVNDRRLWFTDLHTDDYEYAFSYYRKVKEKVKELAVAIKLTEERIATEENRKLSPEAILSLQKVASEKRAKIQEMIRLKPGGEPSSGRTEQQLKCDLEAMLMAVEKQLTAFELGPIPINKEIEPYFEESIRNLEEEINTLSATLNRGYGEYEQRQKRLAKMKDVSHERMRELADELNQAQQAYESLKKQHLLQPFFKEMGDIQNPEHVLWYLEKVQERCVELSEFLTQHSDLRQVSRVDIEASLTLCALLDRVVSEQRVALEQLDRKLSQLDEKAKQAEVECPECRYKWRLDYDEQEHKRLIAIREGRVKQLEEKTIELDAAKRKYSTQTAVFVAIDEFETLCRRHQELDVFWDHVVSSELLYDPQSFQQKFQLLRQCVVEQVSLSSHVKKIDELSRNLAGLKEILSSFSEAELLAEKAEMEKFDIQLSHLANTVTQLRNSHSALSKTLKQYRDLQAMADDIVTLFNQWQGKGKQQLREMIGVWFDELIHEESISLAALDREISQAQSRDQLMKELRDEADRLKRDRKLLQAAEAALSPSSGLIAKGMIGFINDFIDEMNAFIEEVWLDPMEISHVKISEEGDALDYNFAVKVNGQEVSPDISDTSMGMREIIDLAFVVVSMQKMGFGQYPLFLDEFAAHMDAANKMSAYRAVDHLCNATEFSHVFMTSHHEAGYSSLNNAEILVLCPAHVEIPSHLKVNTCAMIT